MNISDNYFYCDSNTLAYALRFFTSSSYYKCSGSHVAKLLTKLDQSRVLYLTHAPLMNATLNQYVLPDLSKEEMDLELRDHNMDNIEILVIGISSPAQNILAQKLYQRHPHLEIYCIGAMVPKIFEESLFVYNIANGLGIEVLIHLISTPRRTIRKISSILYELLILLINKNERDKFRMLGTKLQEGKNASINQNLLKK